MTVANCNGCQEEFSQAIMYQSKGLHLVQQEITKIGLKGHIRIMLVNDDGKIVVM